MPRMDNKDASRRFPQPPASHPSPPQATADPSNTANRRNTSGTEFGSPGGLRAARQPPRRQQPQSSQGVSGANEFAQNSVPSDPGRAVNAYATIPAGDGQQGPTGHDVHTHVPQSGQQGSRAQAQSVFAGYGGPASSLSPPTASPHLPGIKSSGSSSPTSSVVDQLSRPGGGGHSIPPDATHASGVAAHAHSAITEQMGGVMHAQGTSNALPASINPGPPYDTYAHAVGLAHPSFGGSAHGMMGGAPQRPPTRRFATSEELSPPSNVLDDPRHIQGPVHFGSPNATPGPQTPQLDFRTRQLSLEDSPVHFGGPLHPQQHPYGLPPQPFQPPPPMGPMGMLQRPHPELPLTHIEAASLGENLTLAMLSDNPIAGEKPNYPYPTLIRAAILGSPRRALTLQGIYRALEDRFAWFRIHKNDKAWQNSIRHNLSLNKVFRRLQKPITEPGKGSYWTVDFGAGEGNKRDRKRVKRGSKASDAPSTSRLAAEHSSSEEEGDSQPAEMSHGQSLQAPFPGPGRPMYEPYIKPALLHHGHIVGQDRMLPPRSPRLRQAPYALPPLSMLGPAPGMQVSHVAALGQFSVRPGQTTTFGPGPVPGQGPFDAWEASFMAGPPLGMPAWATQPSGPPTFDAPMTPSHQPLTLAHVTRGRPVRAMTTGSLATEIPSASSSQASPPVDLRSPAAMSTEAVGGSAAGTSSSSASEAGSVHSVAGPSGTQAARRNSGSSSSSLSYE